MPDPNKPCPDQLKDIYEEEDSDTVVYYNEDGEQLVETKDDFYGKPTKQEYGYSWD